MSCGENGCGVGGNVSLALQVGYGYRTWLGVRCDASE